MDRYRGNSSPSRWDGNFVTRLVSVPRAYQDSPRRSATSSVRSSMVGATYFSNPYRYKIPPLLYRGVYCTHRAGGTRWYITGEDKQKSDDSEQLVEWDLSFSPTSFWDEFIEIVAELFRKRTIIAPSSEIYRWLRKSEREKFRHLQGHPRGLTNIRSIRNSGLKQKKVKGLCVEV